MAVNAEDFNALTTYANTKDMEAAQAKKALAEVKKGMPGLSMLGIGGVAVATSVVIRGAEGYRHEGDPVKKKALGSIGPILAIVAGTTAAVAMKDSPKVRAAGFGTALAGTVLLAGDLAEQEGVAMALERLKALKAAPAAGAPGATTAPPGQPGVGGYRART